jgi:hypothetical protein
MAFWEQRAESVMVPLRTASARSGRHPEPVEGRVANARHPMSTSSPASWPDGVMRSVILTGEFDVLLGTYRQLVDLAPTLDGDAQDKLMELLAGFSAVLVGLARRADPHGAGRKPLP